MSHREALQEIIKICRESSEMSRRTQKCLDVALRALGYTESQRAEIFVKALQRSEEFKENQRLHGTSAAKQKLKLDTEADTGETRMAIRKKAAEAYV